MLKRFIDHDFHIIQKKSDTQAISIIILKLEQWVTMVLPYSNAS